MPDRMAESSNDAGDPSTKLTIETSPRALADINYNSIIAADRNTSDDDDAPEIPEIPEEDAQKAIGVSISREQTRLTSPQTPAVEKAAAIERAGGFFGLDGSGRESTLVEEPEEDEDEGEEEDIGQDPMADEADDKPQPPVLPSKPSIPERSPSKTPVRLPSPWRVDAPTQWYQSPKGKPGILDNLFNRKRSSTGPEPTFPKSLLSSLPSMPKSFSLSSSISGANDTKASSNTESEKSSKRTSAQYPVTQSERDVASATASGRYRAASDSSMSGFTEDKHIKASLEAVASPSSTHTLRPHPYLLRRSTSDQSLVTHRTLSKVESLGDDSRFEHVQDQVNSRLKAIKDSWQDSNIRLPSLSNLSIASFTPDFMRDRSASVNKRQSLKPVDDTRTSSRNMEDEHKPQRPVDPMTRQPYSSAKAAMADATSGKTSTHPHFKRALENLEGDVVILGGYRGSILRSADPPHRQVWVPVKVGLNLRKVDLQVGLEEDSDERATEQIIPGGMLTHIGPVDIARRLFKRLRACKNAESGKLRVHDYGYDWRLDPAYLSKQLISFLETLPCNKPDERKEKKGALVLAHSLGGLITRHAVNKRPELFRGILYAGVPNTCVNILGPMRNGDEVLLSNRVLTAQVNFSIRTSFALLPLDGRCFFDKTTKEEYPVDFFDPQTWVDLRLSPCVGRPLPPLVTAPKSSGMAGYMSSMSSALPNLPLPGRKANTKSKGSPDPSKSTEVSNSAEPDMAESNAGGSIKTLATGNVDTGDDSGSNSVATTVTISREKAFEYLTRTLASVKTFKQDLAFNSEHAASNTYPPISVIYGKSTPTVFGAKVDGRDSIKHADAYDQLAFASGDGVVLARAAMVPEGYTTTRGGVVSSERGHVTLLSDLEAVGKCLNAIMLARRRGVGLGN